MFVDPHAFHIKTFGCQMNAHDSDWLRRSLEARGFRQAAFEEAGLYIVNTCSVRDKPEQKVYSELGRIARHAKVNGRKGVTVAVGGCVAQQAGAGLVKRFPQVRLIFGTDGISRAPEALARLAEEPDLRLSLLEFTEGYEERPAAVFPGRAPASAFVNIMQGCDNFCTYCIVPYVRGRQKSRAAGEILAECRNLLENGCREITLLGQNVNSYGQDPHGQGADFPSLLESILALPDLLRLRFVTPHPKDIDPRVIAAFGRHEALAPRLHLPLQSGSDRILKAMGRRYDTARYRDIVATLRAARPDIALTTDVIVGFPGETEEDFQATMRLMEETGFIHSFSFVYSDRPMAGAGLLPDKVERAVALERLTRLQDAQNRFSEGVLAEQVGRECVVLVESAAKRPVVLPDSAEKTDNARGQSGVEHIQGKTPHGFIVNAALPVPPAEANAPGFWTGKTARVRVRSAGKHSLRAVPA